MGKQACITIITVVCILQLLLHRHVQKQKAPHLDWGSGGNVPISDNIFLLDDEEIEEHPQDPNDILLSSADAARHLNRTLLWLVSHGGVGSENLCKHLGPSCPGVRPKIRDVTAHYPHPISASGLKLAIYMYGGAYKSILSHLRRHPDSSRKLHNSKSDQKLYGCLEHPYPGFATERVLPLCSPLSELINLLRDGEEYARSTKRWKREPFGIETQFRAFSEYSIVAYPIVLLRSNALKYDWVRRELHEIVKNQTGTETGLLSSFEYSQSSTSYSEFFLELPAIVRQKFVNTYSTLDKMMEGMPPLVVRWPASISNRINVDGVLSGPSQPDISSTLSKLKLEGINDMNQMEYYSTIGTFSIFSHRHSSSFSQVISWNNLSHGGGPWIVPSSRTEYDTGNIQYGLENPISFEWLGMPFAIASGIIDDDESFGSKQRAMYLLDLRMKRITILQLQGNNGRNVCILDGVLQQRCTLAPYVHLGQLHFIQSLYRTKFRVLRLVDDSTGECIVVRNEEYFQDANIDDKAGEQSSLVATSLIPWAYPMYIGLATRRSKVAIFAFDVERYTPYFNSEVIYLSRINDGKSTSKPNPYHISLQNDGSHVRLGVNWSNQVTNAPATILSNQVTWYHASTVQFGHLLSAFGNANDLSEE